MIFVYLRNIALLIEVYTARKCLVICAGGITLTKKELSELYWLNREIKEEKRKLAELEAAATDCTAKITGLPHVSVAHDKIGDLSILIAEQKDFIELKVKQSIIKYNRLNRYIANVSDAQMRMILSLRYVNGLTWQQVADSIGEGNTADAIRKKHDKFLKLSVFSAENVV